GRAEVLISKPYFMEVLAEGVDKGEALRRLAELLGIPLAETLAAGDAMNDLGMLRVAGLGCAPSNAIPAAKEAAAYVSTLSHEEDFVADLVRRFVLGAEA
ncbi:MAG: HAD family phosphatase, partial [Spirochaetaceae bacterium]|nr:HAD family phosphatase [Spirochaetaceae bacterium]